MVFSRAHSVGDTQGASSVMEADLVISFKVFRERFGSRVVLHPDDMKSTPNIWMVRFVT